MAGLRGWNEREFEFTEELFEAFRRICREQMGIHVPDHKVDLFYARLSKRVRALKLDGFDEYLQFLQSHSEAELKFFINALTINQTAFFRECHHFEFLRDRVIPDALNTGKKSLRIWSAGCSSGEEAYSIALTMAAATDSCALDWKILASDIDTHVLSQAALGIYEQTRLENLPLAMKERWFLKGKGKNQGLARVTADLRSHIEFRKLNLTEPFCFDESFDVIFCRNVIIYFDHETKLKLLQGFEACMKADSYLVMGHAESLHGLVDNFVSKGKTIYRLLR